MNNRRVIEPTPTFGIRRPLSWLVFVVLFGTAGFMFLEGWSPWHALYFTLVTITTVGYGDDGISAVGRGWAAILLVGGIVIASYAVSQLLQSAMVRQFEWRHRMQQRVNKVSRHTIVCGYGRMGVTICEQLAAEHASFVVVEQDEHALEHARSKGYLCVEGCASEDDTLIHAGVQRARCIVAAADLEATNIVTTLSARELNPSIMVIARAEREEEVRKLLRAGATHVVSPFQSGGLEVAHRILRPRVADLLISAPHAKARVSLAEISVEPGSPLDGVCLGVYGRGSGTRLSFVALDRPDEDTIVRPPGETELRAGDLLVVAGGVDDIIAMRGDGVAASKAA